MSDLRDYLDATLGDTPGYLHIAVGHKPHLSESGKYEHELFAGSHFAWPAEADQAEREMLWAAPDSDIYVCPYLMHADKRTPAAAVARQLVHADIDGGLLDADKVREVSGFAVASGTPGNGHVYVALTEPVPAHWHKALCRGLGAYLGAVDAKISANDVLRPPGTLNHKPTVTGGDPAPVQLLIRPSGVRWEPHALAQLLGVTLPEAITSTAGPVGVMEKIDLTPHPRVQAAVAKNTGDRSADTMRVVGACRDAGFTLAQTRYAVGTRADLAARLAERNDDDILTCWLKAVDSRQAGKVGQPAGPVPTVRAVANQAAALAEAHGVFQRWLGDEYDLDALDVVLAAAAAERLGGDPLWVLLVSGSGNAKTETAQSLQNQPATHVISTISSPGALLSATSKRDKSPDATGGLLREVGERGVLVIKDVTSILSMSRELRGEVLAALREIYDGRWSRNVGTDGGRTLEWIGRIVVVGAVTTAWDTAHSVVAAMGDRFVLLRLDSTKGRQAAGKRAIGNTGSETQMRAELAQAFTHVVSGASSDTADLDDDDRDLLLAAADLVTLARTGVEFDYRGDVIDAHAPEMPTRFAKQLAQVVRGGVAVGMSREDAMRLAIRCARDSVPPMRLAIVDYLAGHPHSTTSDVRKGIDKPRSTVDRQLQALHMLGVLDCFEEETQDSRTRWRYAIRDDIRPEALVVPPKKSPEKSLGAYATDKTGSEYDSLGTPSDTSGDISGHRCEVCGQEMCAPASIERGHCERCELATRAAS